MITLKVFSKLMGVSERQIQRYVQQGMPTVKIGKRNHYDGHSIQWSMIWE